jgi:hypothetical protein
MRIQPDANAVDAPPNFRSQVLPCADGGATMSEPLQSWPRGIPPA